MTAARALLFAAGTALVSCAAEVVDESVEDVDTVDFMLDPVPTIGALPSAGPVPSRAMLLPCDPEKPTPDPWKSDPTGESRPDKPTPDPWNPGEHGDPSESEGAEE